MKSWMSPSSGFSLLAQSGQYFQGFKDADLIGKGAVVVFLREAGIRDDQALKGMSDDDERNVLIVEKQ